MRPSSSQVMAHPEASGGGSAPATPGAARPLWPIQLKLALAVGAVAAAAVVSLTAMQTVFELAEFKNRALDQGRRTSELTGWNVERLVTNAHQQLAGLAADPDLVSDALAGDADPMNRRLEAIAPIDPDLTVLAAIDAQGLLWATSSLTKGALGSDFRDQRHVRTALDQGVPGVGTARLGLTTRLPIVPLGVPVRADGRIIGVLQGSLSLGTLSEHLTSIRLGQRGHVQLVSDDGVILAHPDGRRILTPASPANQAIREALQGRPSSLETIDDSGVAVLASAVRLSSLGWIVEASVPVDEALQPLRARVARAAALAFIALAVAAGLGIAIARRLMAPVGVLREATRRMARGEYEPSSLTVRTGDELESLAEDFNAMAAKLEESERRYRTVSELTTDFAYAYSVLPDGTLVPEWVTDAFTHITGFSIAEVASMGGWLSLVHPEDEPIAQRRRRRLFSGRPVTDEFRIVTKSGEIRSLRVHARPVWDQDRGHVVHIFGAAQDITEHKLAERELIQARAEIEAAQRAEALKSDLISMVSHEVRTPLSVLLGFSELLVTREVSEDERRHWVGLIHTEASRLGEIIDDLLQVSRIDAGAVELRLGPVELRQVAQSVVEMYSSLPNVHQFALDADGGEITVMADPERLYQILENLVSNAVKYSPEGGPVRLTLTRQGDRGVVAVTDNGLGIPAEELPKLFTRFHRVDRPDRAHIRGTGLGLYITHQLVDLHGGSIEVSSEPGVGSTFTVSIPLVSPTFASSSRRGSRATDPRRAARVPRGT